jgi:hypothetical protein
MSTKLTNSPPPSEPNPLKAPQVEVTYAFSNVKCRPAETPNIPRPKRMDDIQAYVKVGSLVPHSKFNLESHDILQGLEDFDE